MSKSASEDRMPVKRERVIECDSNCLAQSWWRAASLDDLRREQGGDPVAWHDLTQGITDFWAQKIKPNDIALLVIVGL